MYRLIMQHTTFSTVQYCVSTIGGRRGIAQLSEACVDGPVGNHASTTPHESLSSSVKLALGSQHFTPMNSAHFSCFLMADRKNQAGAAPGEHCSSSFLFHIPGLIGSGPPVPGHCSGPSAPGARAQLLPPLAHCAA